MDSLFPTPSAGFDHPLDILGGCHERILRNCGLIERLAEHIRVHGADDQARTAAANVIRYFETAGANHHRDEEEDLFPALQQYTPSEELNAVFDVLHRLKADHRRLDGLWKSMRERLETIAAGRESPLTVAGASAFKAAYERHIALEESRVIPLARRVLDERLLRALGARMARRRGVSTAA